MNILVINHRSYEFQQTIINTLEYEPDINYYCELKYLNVIEVIGSQSMSFLQGQLTNDIHQISTHQIQKNLLCNLKGQIISKLWVGKNEDSYYLICPKDLNTEILGLLSKTAPLSRVTFNPSNTKKVYGLIANQTLVLSTSKPTDYIKKPDLFWHHQCLLHNQFEIYPSTCRLFLPHHLQMEQSGWISFQKGCYRGQEIIARMHYLGKSKYQLKIFTSNSSLIVPGDVILNQNKQAIGELIDYCPINQNENLVIACIKKDYENDTLTIQGKE